MKTFQILALMLVALVGMTACSNDDDNGHKLIIDSITKEYTGKNAVTVVSGTSRMGPYYADITCTVTTFDGGTISITYPEYVLPNLPMMGDLTLGAYTISNIPYDEEKGAFYLDTEGVTEHLKMGTRVDDDYLFKKGSFIQVEKSETGIKVINNFQLVNPKTGKEMPFPIETTFEGTITNS